MGTSDRRKLYNGGGLMIRIAFLGKLYYNCNQAIGDY